MAAKPCGGLLQYQYRQSPTMLQRWVDHVEGWSQLAGSVTFVNYEGLHRDFNGTLTRIADILGQKPGAIRRPTLMSHSSLPWRGEIGNWKRYFTSADEQYFMKHAGHLLERQPDMHR
jgi:hypothetical protein